jgi:hypothetical protein
MVSIFPEVLKTNVLSTLKNKRGDVPYAPVDDIWTQKVLSKNDTSFINKIDDHDQKNDSISAFFMRCHDPVSCNHFLLRNKIINAASDLTNKNKVHDEINSIMNSSNFILFKYGSDALTHLCQVCNIEHLVVINSREGKRVHTIHVKVPEENKDIESNAQKCYIIDESTNAIQPIFDKNDEYIKLANSICNENNIPEDFPTLRKYKAFIFDNKSMEKRITIYEKVKELFNKSKSENNVDRRD